MFDYKLCHHKVFLFLYYVFRICKRDTATEKQFDNAL